VAAGGVLRC